MQTLRAPRATLLVLATLALSALAACDANGRINGSVHVAPGEQAGEVSTVNGAVEVGERASVAGMHTVNGHLSLGESARAGSMHTVNGAVEIAALAQVTATQAAVVPLGGYGLRAEIGVFAVAADASGAVAGRDLLALQAALDADDFDALRSACSGPAAALRRQLRELLAYHLGAAPLRTRQVLLDLQPLMTT